MTEPSLQRTPGLVSVVLANHDYGRYLPEALDALVHQTYPHVETIVVDDGSTDGSAEVFSRWQAVHRPSGPVIFHRLPRNCGYAWAMNVGVALARGEFVAFHDADDISHFDRLRRQVLWMRENPGGALVGTNYQFFFDGAFEHKRAVYWLAYGPRIPRVYAAGGHCVSVGTVMVRGSVLDELGPFNRRVAGAEDYELVARIVAAGRLVDNLKTPLYFNRVHGLKRSRLYYGRATRRSTDEPPRGCPAPEAP